MPEADGAKLTLMVQVELAAMVEQLLVWVKLLFTAPAMEIAETLTD